MKDVGWFDYQTMNKQIQSIVQCVPYYGDIFVHFSEFSHL